mmetsp:Transcript_10281/g.29327  ORF Transcript_10281/g.29327 Transcript_10281/m.29327 type:complete len:207 (+) Transcript_10281:721-1341(+)
MSAASEWILVIGSERQRSASVHAWELTPAARLKKGPQFIPSAAWVTRHASFWDEMEILRPPVKLSQTLFAWGRRHAEARMRVKNSEKVMPHPSTSATPHALASNHVRTWALLHQVQSRSATTLAIAKDTKVHVSILTPPIRLTLAIDHAAATKPAKNWDKVDPSLLPLATTAATDIRHAKMWVRTLRMAASPSETGPAWTTMHVSK